MPRSTTVTPYVPIELQPHIIITGNVVDGLKFQGPYPTAKDAWLYATHNISRDDWRVVLLAPPTDKPLPDDDD